MSSMIKERMNTILYFLLNEIFDKFDVIAFKKIVDYLFTFSEKIIIHYPRILPFYIDYYDDIIDNEIQIAQITSETKILHIGCGSIPASIILLAKKTGAIISAEDHSIIGGLGSAISETLVKNYPVPMEFVGINNQFGQSGAAEKLMQHYRLLPKDIISAVKKSLERKN